MPIYSRLIVPVLLIFGVHRRQNVQAMNFNGKINTAWFDPRIYPDGHHIDEHDLLNMITIVATRFKGIMLREITDSPEIHEEYQKAVQMIPVATAKYNKVHRPECGPDLQMSMMYMPNKNENFDKTLKVAKLANSVYKGTVREFLMKYDDEHPSQAEESVKNLTDSLKHARTQLEAHDEFQLGALFSIEVCSRSRFMEELSRHLDTITFGRYVGVHEIELDLRTQVSISIRQLESCKRAIAKINKAIPIRFVMDYPDTSENGTQDLARFVTFWEKMEKWATASNTDVIVYEAFDNGKTPSYDTTGWWRVKASWSGFVIEEKLSVAQGKKTQLTPYCDDRSSATSYPGIYNEIFLAIGILVLNALHWTSLDRMF